MDSIVHKPITDFSEEDLIKKLQSAIDALKKLVDSKEGSKIFVHCTAGMSRSVSVVAGYMCQNHGMAS